MQNRRGQIIGREYAQARRVVGIVAHQHMADALLVQHPRHIGDGRARIDIVRRAQHGGIYARERERLHFVLRRVLREGLQFVSQT